MTDPALVNKFILKLDELIENLELNQNLFIHRHVEQFYYMQKVSEFKLLLEQFEETRRKMDTIANRLDQTYQTTYNRWRRDLKWLHAYERSKV